MALNINLANETIDLLSLNAVQYNLLNKYSKDVQQSAAKTMVEAISPEEFQTAVKHLVPLCLNHPNYLEEGFDSFVGTMIAAYIAKHDEDAMIHLLFKQNKTKEFFSYKFSEPSKAIFATLNQLVEDKAKQSKDKEYLQTYAKHFFAHILTAIITNGAKPAERKITPFVLGFTLRSLKEHLLGGFTTLLSTNFPPKIEVVSSDVATKLKAVQDGVAEEQQKGEADPEKLQQVLDKTDELTSGKTSVKEYEAFAKTFQNTDLHSLGILMLALAAAFAVATVAAVAGGAPILLSSVLGAASLVATGAAIRFFSQNNNDATPEAAPPLVAAPN